MQKELTTAIHISKEVGYFLNSMFRSEKTQNNRNKTESGATNIDLFCNEMIINRLTEEFPDDKILSEESPETHNIDVNNGRVWIIDPLDGSTNFMAGLPIFAVTLALISNGTPLFGVIYDPVNDNLFVGIKNKGARINSVPIKTSGRNLSDGAVMLAGRGHRNRDKLRHSQMLVTLEQDLKYFRRLGSAAIMLSSTAAGWADAVILTGNQLWDTVAGVLIIQEAGGTITDYCGNEWTTKSEDLVASNGFLQKNITNITKTIYEERCVQ